MNYYIDIDIDIDKSGFVEEIRMQFKMISCNEEDAEFIEERAGNAFNLIAQPEEDEEEFVYIITDESGDLLGGCILSVDGLKTASIYDLWVEEAFRRQGMASALIREAEREAREQGCYLAMVGTFDWQAKSFYDKHGYMLNDTMTGVPKGHEHYMLTKRLDRTTEEYFSSNTSEYEIRRGEEKDAEILSGKLHEYDSAIAPREHEYIPLSKKIMDENGRIIAGFAGGAEPILQQGFIDAPGAAVFFQNLQPHDIVLVTVLVHHGKLPGNLGFDQHRGAVDAVEFQ
jgi:GNAT superfamily N-acetyltransferase